MNEEEMRAEIVRLTDENKTLKETNENLANDVKAKDERITSLQEHNQKLFMRVTSPVTPEPEVETDSEKVNKLCDSILKVKKI